MVQSVKPIMPYNILDRSVNAGFLMMVGIEMA